MKFVANRSSYMPDGRISLRVTVIPDLEVRRDTLTAPMEGLQATFLDRIGLHDLKLIDEILKFSVINRGGRKSIQTHKMKTTVRPSAYHGFGIFVLSNLTAIESSTTATTDIATRLQETAQLGKIRDINRLKKQISKTSNLGGTDESQLAYGYEDEQTFAESEKKRPAHDSLAPSSSKEVQIEHLTSTDSTKLGPILQRKFEIDVFSSISDELAKVYSNTMLIGLQYEPETEKLSLQVIRASLAPSKLKHNQASYYGKVTLFEGRKVVKAKKTRPISAFLRRTEHILESSTKPSLPNTLTESRTETAKEELSKNINQNPEFEETFCILFPPQYLDHVSCIVSLCGKTKSGAKINFGRAYIGSQEHATQSGFKHWEEMAANPNSLIIRNHYLDNPTDIERK